MVAIETNINVHADADANAIGLAPASIQRSQRFNPHNAQVVGASRAQNSSPQLALNTPSIPTIQFEVNLLEHAPQGWTLHAHIQERNGRKNKRQYYGKMAIGMMSNSNMHCGWSMVSQEYWRPQRNFALWSRNHLFSTTIGKKRGGNGVLIPIEEIVKFVEKMASIAHPMSLAQFRINSWYLVFEITFNVTYSHRVSI